MTKYFIALCLLVFPLLAMADSSSLSLTPPITDYSIKFLGNIFGVVDGVLHGTGSQIMGNIFGVFNAAVLALGGIVIMYTLIVGTMNTAQEGEMLGRKWSSIWIPVRSTMGLALLIPKASGYCLMQIFVMWMIVQGVGAADKVWNSALDYLNRGGVIMQAQMDPKKSKQADDHAIAAGASAMLAGEVCMLGLQKQLEAQRQLYLDQQSNGGGGPCPSAQGDMKYFCETAVPDFISSVDFVGIQQSVGSLPDIKVRFKANMPNFDDDTYGKLNGICGAVAWKPLVTGEDSKSENETTTKGGALIGASFEKNSWDVANINTLSDDDIRGLQSARPTALQQMYLDYAMVAREMVANDPLLTPRNDDIEDAYPTAHEEFGVPYLSSGTTPCTVADKECTQWKNSRGGVGATLFMGTEFQDGITDYNAIMAPTVNLLNDARKADSAEDKRAFIRGSKEQGWLTAGSYFFDLVRLNGSATGGANQTDTDTGLENSKMDPSLPQEAYSGEDDLCVGDYAFLCYVLPKSKVDEVVALVGGTVPTQNTLGQAIATSGAESSTVTGFIPNSLVIHLPGQPGLSSPTFGMHFNFKLEKGLFRLPKKKFNCGLKILGSCIGREMGKFFYNTLIKDILDFFLDTIGQVINLVIMAVLSVPLEMMSTIFVNGVDIIKEPGVNPIVALADMGVAYINQAAVLWVSILNLTTMFAPLAPIIGPIVVMAAPLVIAWMSVMVAIGFITAYYIPFVPFMIFTFGVIAWLMVVIEAMVAAPIVALGITHPEGEGAFGKGEQALMILMNVFLRPTMMIIGYIAGIGLCYVSVWVINTGFGHVVQFIQGTPGGSAWSGGGYTNWAGIYGLFFSVLIYTTLYLIVTEKAFNLIYILPDQILRWIGGHPEHSGAEAAKWGEEAQRKVSSTGDKTEGAQAQISKQSAALVDEKKAQVGKGIDALTGDKGKIGGNGS